MKQLDLFGSAVGEGFDPGHSDIDFIADFGPQAQPELFNHYFGLKQTLELLFGRRVDLVMAAAMTNPHFIKPAALTCRTVYASPLAQAA